MQHHKNPYFIELFATTGETMSCRTVQEHPRLCGKKLARFFGMKIDAATGLKLAYPVYDYRITDTAQMQSDLVYSVGSFEGLMLPRSRSLVDALRNDPAAPCGRQIAKGRYFNRVEIEAYIADYCGSYQAFREVSTEIAGELHKKDAACEAAIVKVRAEAAEAVAESVAMLEAIRNEIDAKLAQFLLDFEKSFSIDATERLQARCGVYFLRKGDAIVYIGQSVNVYSRVTQHEKGKDFDSVTFVPCTQDQLNDLEGFYIRLIKPPLNGYSRQKPLGRDNGAPRSRLWEETRNIAWVRGLADHVTAEPAKVVQLKRG